MRLILKFFRKTVRFAIAAFLWSHALFLINIAPPSVSPVASRLGLTSNEFELLFAIVGLSLLRFYGWGALFVDFLYIYCFPFVLPFAITWTIFTAVRFFLSIATPRTPATSLASAKPSSPSIIEASSTAKEFEKDATQAGWRGLIRSALRPLFAYTMLWGMLAAISQQPILQRFATALALIGTLRVVYLIMKFGFISKDWLSELEQKIQTNAEKWIVCIAAWNDAAEPTAEIKEAWNGLKAIQVAIAVLRNKQIVIQWTIALGCVLFGVIYTYVAVLFSFSYTGLSHIYGIHFDWSDSITTSFLLPISFSDLPRVTAIRLLGGLQYLFIFVAGVGTIFGYLKRKVETIQNAATIMNLKMQREEVMKSFTALEKKIGPIGAAKAAAASKPA